MIYEYDASSDNTRRVILNISSVQMFMFLI